MLARDADPATDPVLPLRVAAAAAAGRAAARRPTRCRGWPRAPAPLPEPWPDEARDALVALLGAGRPRSPVFESLDQAGLMVRLFPEWDGRALQAAAQRGPPLHRRPAPHRGGRRGRRR